MTNARQVRRTVVVGVDGSDESLRAVRWGAHEARRRGVPLRLVDAFACAAQDVRHPGSRQRYRDLLLDRARARVAEAAAAVEKEVPGVDVEHQVVVGPPIAVLGTESRRAQLIVVGDRGLSRIEGLLAGSVAVGLTTGADCPVVVVRGPVRDESSTGLLPIVVGIDGSATSEAATAFAFEAAAARRVPVVAVHTWQDLLADPALAPVLDLDAIDTDERHVLSDRLAGWTEKYPDVPVQPVVSRDRPARALLHEAARAQLLVVGSRGRRELAGLVLGSVSNAVVHRAPCPVAVVRPDASGRV